MFIQSSVKSIKVLLLPEMAAVGEMLAGISSRRLPPSMLAWDEVSAVSSRPPGLCGEDMRTTAVVGLLGGDC